MSEEIKLTGCQVHGVWDAQSKFLGPNLAPHTNITEIDMGLDLLWRAGVEPGKVVLGLGWVGSSLCPLTDCISWSDSSF